MSATPNSATVLPPSASQMDIVNGLPTEQQQTEPSLASPQPEQQQQSNSQQILSSQFQQQQILQQKLLQQQFPGVPFATNMSKFMPPTSATSTASAAVASTSPTSPASTPAPQPTSLNSSGANSSSTAAQPSLPANLPPHLRPSSLIGGGPPGSTASAPTTAAPVLTNGGSSANLSSNSSRTGSPSLQGSPAHQLQPGVATNPPAELPSQSSEVPATKYAPASLAVSTPVPSSVATTPAPSLTSSMQNLSLNPMNGSNQLKQQQAFPQSASSRSNSFQANLQANFKTSALNSNYQQPNATIYPATNPLMQMPPLHQPLSTPAMPQQQFFRPPPVASSPSSYAFPSTQSSSVYGTSSVPLMMRPPQMMPPNSTIQNANPSLMPPSNAAFQQNQLNNNQIQPPPLAQQQQFLPLSPPPTQQQTRKPMYPPASQLPPMPAQHQQQQQQQQPYLQAYQQPATFNGQINNTPMQYQSQQQQYQSPQQLQQQQYPSAPNYNPQMSVTNQGFNRLWGQDTVDLMQNRHILSPATLPMPKISLQNQFHESINCNPSIIRCTIAKIPDSNSLLQKSRLPLGILIHPFRDVNSLPVIQCPNIVRCRLCRTYINPFVYFVDSKMWKCNLCYRVNELPDDFQFDPATKTYGDVTRRPEVRSSTIEFIAPSEYMLRPPQPAIYLFLFDVSIIAQQTDYLENICATLMQHLDDIPGDARTKVGFIAFNSHVHFYSMSDGYSKPHEITLVDIDDPFLPRPDNLLVNLREYKEMVKELLVQLPKRFAHSHDPGSALGAALQVAYKLMQCSGGRVTVFQTCLPNKGSGSLEPREDPNNRSAKDVMHLNPATDFYKRYALECSGYQIAVDLFLLNQQYCDLATISGISKHSGGCVYHFPLYQQTKAHHVDSLRQCFKRYLTRKIGFEAVMRIRCTRGLQVHTFHGNFFVRSTDLLSLPNVNPDAGYGMQISYEESLTDVRTICFQAALLYTNSEGERRIRVHTLCLPVTASLAEVMHAADTEAIIGLLSKMAVDRSLTSNISDAREAFINAIVDVLSAFKIAQNLPQGQTAQLIAPRSLALMPLYILALLKHPAFRVGTSTRLDDRVYAMDCMKTLPLDQLMKFVYPEFYNIDALFCNVQNSNSISAEDDSDDDLPDLPRLQLSAEHLDSRSIFLLDCGTLIIIYVGLNVPVNILENVLGIKSTAELPDYYYGLPAVNSSESDVLKRFIMKLNDDKPYSPVIQIIRDTSTAKPQFIEKLVDDRNESSLSYYEFLQHIRTQVK